MTYFSTADEMGKLDDLAVENGLEIRQMMELAGWHILKVFNELDIGKDKRVVVVVGKGNKGGDGLCAARHLINHGWGVDIVLLAEETDLSPDSHHQYKLLNKIEASCTFYTNKDKVNRLIEDAGVVIDALIGYRLKGAPRDDYGEMVNLINKSGCKVISYDVPTGIDSTTGECFDPSINANATLTLALPKKTFEKSEAKEKSGKIFLGDIGIPSYLYDKLKKDSRPEFGSTGIVML